MQIRLARGHTLAERHRRREPGRVEMPIGGPSGNMVVPAPADRVVEQDALEAMIGADRPIAPTRERG